MKTEQFKGVSTVIGAGAAVVMVGVGIAFSTVSAAQEPVIPGPVPTPEATGGQTVTKTVAPSKPEVSRAKPSKTGPAPLPPEEQGLPG